MQRTKFIKLLIAAMAPAVAFTKNITKIMKIDKGFKVPAGEGRLHGHLKLKGVNANILDLKISGTDTSGGMSIFEQTSISKGRGTPLHVHYFQNEVFYVLEGEYQFKVGDENFKLTKGDSIFLPMNIPHAWTQLSATGKMTVIFQPAGKMEEFFVSLAAFDHEPTPNEMKKLFADCEMEIVGPALIE